ncbi:hypothetical protein Z211_01269 [Streptococcus pyogenes ABC020035446]|nr:hypothetical protein Z381_01081 [Streptococcus pyogenes ABC020050731]EZM18223.1 hypothetical protein Z211_01269 [Streptococcus pyogenes ABC020035446]
MDEKNPLEQFEEFCKNNSFEYVKGWVDGMQSVLNILSMELSKKMDLLRRLIEYIVFF